MKSLFITVHTRDVPVFLRFVLVGALFSLGYALLSAGLITFGAPPFWTPLLLYSLAIPIAYTAQRKFAFRITTNRWKAFFVYLTTQLVSFAFVCGVTARFVTQTFWIDVIIYLFMATLAAVMSFVVNKTFAFGSGNLA